MAVGSDVDVDLGGTSNVLDSLVNVGAGVTGRAVGTGPGGLTKFLM